jgi:rubrerythrin
MTNNEKVREIAAFLSISSMRHVEMFDSLIADNNAAIFNLEAELKWLKQQVKLGQQKIFDRSTETLESLERARNNSYRLIF